MLIIMLLPSGDAPKTGKKPQLTATKSTKKADDLILPEDYKAKFDDLDKPMVNSFVPLVTKRDINGPVAKNGIPADFAGGETTWVYTGNMTVDGTPNALLENTASGDGIFLRPGQHWKALKLVAVREDSIEIEGPGGAMKTVYYNELEITASMPDSGTLSPLPPATPQAVPNSADGNSNRRRRRNQNNGGGGQQFADGGNLSGPIGQANSGGDPSFQPQGNVQFISKY